MLNNLSPIALFVYNRPKVTANTLAHLMRNPEFADSVLHVFCDGPKDAKDRPLVEATRQTVRKLDLPNVILYEQPQNLGLGSSVIRGVTQLCAEYGRVIVLEDDLLVARGFLDYMNRALNRYESADKVMHISGHMFPFRKAPDTGSAFFLPVTSSWGWATWQRAWDSFNLKGIGHEALHTDKNLRKQFDLDGAYPYSKMMFAHMSGEKDDWAIQWWWSVFSQNGLCLYPRDSLIKNVGFGMTATHTKAEDTYINDPQWSADRIVLDLPERIEIDAENYALLKKHLVSNYASISSKINRQLTKFRNLLLSRLQ